MALLSEVSPGRVLFTASFPLMGGWGRVEFVDDRGRGRAARIARAVEAEARRIELKFSRYRDSSVVSEINRNAGRTPVAVDEETVGLVDIALELSRWTQGRFDPTVGVLRRAWNFRTGRVPSERETEALLPLVDASSVSTRNGTIFLRKEGMEIDLGGVGKEYAVDAAANVLRQEGIEAAIVNFAGDVRTIGTRGDGRPWRIGVIDPRDRARCRFSIRTVAGAGVATSGDYERGFERDGMRYHHILDARTGWPVRGLRSATVLAASTMRAGLFATASFLLGARDGLELLDRTPDVEGVLIAQDGSVLATAGMEFLCDLPGCAWHGWRDA